MTAGGRLMFRTYDTNWNRTGYSETPQYSGQADLSDDYPAKCHCGSPMLGCGDAMYLRLRKFICIKPEIAKPEWVATGYVAWCAKGHEMKREIIAA